MRSPPVVEIKAKKSKKVIIRLGVAEESSPIDSITKIEPRGINRIFIRLSEIEEALPKMDTISPSPLICKMHRSGGNAKCSNCLYCRGHSTTYNYEIGTCFGGDASKIVRLNDGCRNHRFGRFSIYKIRGPRNWRKNYGKPRN